MNPANLRKSMAHGAMWAFVERASNQVISFFVFMLVARLIGPEEYGLANICFVVFSLANLLILGLVDGIISLQIKDDRRLSTMFWLVIGVGIILALACVAGAGGAAALMGEPSLAPLLRWFSLTFLCLSASVIPNKLIYAALDFRVIALRTVIASIISGVVGLGVALIGGGAYAIVAQQIMLQVIINVVVWSNVAWRPTLDFDLSAIPQCMGPGLKTTGINIVLFFEEQTPRVVIGAVLGPVALGFYAFVMRLRFALEEIAINPALSVLYPSLSLAKGKADPSDQEAVLGQVIGLMGWLIFPVLALAMETAPLYVPLFFGPAWSPAVVILQIFMIASAAMPILTTIREALRAHNLAGSYVRLQLVVVGLSLIVSVCLIPFGLVPLSIGAVVCVWASVPIYIHFFKRWLRISLWRPAIGLLKPLTAAALMAALIRYSEHAAAFPEGAWAHLFAALTLGGAVYVLAGAAAHFREARALFVMGRKFHTLRRAG